MALPTEKVYVGTLASEGQDLNLTPAATFNVNITSGALEVGGTEVISSARAGTLASLTLTTALAATDGGTGLDTWAKGEIPYASAANTLAALAVSATDGHVLTWNNTTGLPEWRVASGGASALDDLTDVTITSVADNEVLAYDNGTATWINQTAAEAGLASSSHTHESLTSTGDVTLNADSDGNAAGAILMQINAVTKWQVQNDGDLFGVASTAVLQLDSHDNGSSIGRKIVIGYNTNASTPAASVLNMTSRTGATSNIWIDNAGDVRIGASDPTNANDTSGTVIGTQTSDYRVKTDILAYSDDDVLLDRVLALPLYSYRFQNDAQRGEKLMHGLVIYEGDRGSWWTANDHRADNYAVLDEPALHGAYIGAIKALAARVNTIEGVLGL